MTDERKTILVVGALGRSGGFVARSLSVQGFAVRALIRTQGSAPKAMANGAAAIAIGDLRDAASLDAALDGVYGVYHVGPPFAADEAEMGIAMVQAAKRAKIRKFVFSAVIHPANGLSNHASKLPVEENILKSNLDYTILYPATHFQNFAAGWSAIANSGVYAEPYRPEARLARVDYRDVADVVAQAFLDDRLSYGSFELAADGLPDRTQIAALMTETLGRPVAVATPDFAQWAEALALPLNAAQLKELEKVYESYSDYGSPGNSLTLRAILGRAPRTLKGYFAELAATTPQ